MVRDADATRRRLLDAAAEEFAAFGIAGARVDRIAVAAASNKAQIYHYFGNKDKLYEACLAPAGDALRMRRCADGEALAQCLAGGSLASRPSASLNGVILLVSFLGRPEVFRSRGRRASLLSTS